MNKFLSGKELEDAVYDIIFKAKKYLIIISPYIKLDDYFRKALFDTHLENADLSIVIVFGKNENHINKSFNKEDFEYFKKFPNISIVYAANLHAKYYANEKQSIITSINLYDSSFKHNIEFGVLFESTLTSGERIDYDSYKKSIDIIKGNNAVFVRKPNFRKKLLIGKDYVGSATKYDVTQQLIDMGSVPKKSVSDFYDPETLEAKRSINRVPREEFEEHQEAIKPEKPKPDLKGRCIKCNQSIPLSIKAPYCDTCYNDWKTNQDDARLEKYCHICGKEHTSTKKRPAHLMCFNDYKKSLLSN